MILIFYLRTVSLLCHAFIKDPLSTEYTFKIYDEKDILEP